MWKAASTLGGHSNPKRGTSDGIDIDSVARYSHQPVLVTPPLVETGSSQHAAFCFSFPHPPLPFLLRVISQFLAAF
jgi:hypothetical protein